MKKLTKLQNEKEPEKDFEIQSIGRGIFELIKYKEWEFLSEGDMVVVLPYFRDLDKVLLRYEDIPPYQYSFKNDKNLNAVTNFITILSGSVEKNETLKNTVRREIYEEAGIVLSDMFEIEIDEPLFVSKGCIAKYHPVFIELTAYNYKLVTPPTDGSESEKKSKNLFIEIEQLNNIKVYDVITALMIEKFKSKINLR